MAGYYFTGGPKMSVGFELPEGFRDVIVTHTEIHFCLRDRIRLLFSGVCWLHVETYTENIPGKAVSKSAVMAIGGSALTWDGLYLGPRASRRVFIWKPVNVTPTREILNRCTQEGREGVRMAVIGWVDCGLRLSREPQEDRTMADKAMAYTTETGRGSSKLEQGDVAKAPGEVRGAWPSDHRRAFAEGAAWWEYTKTGGTLRESDRRMTEIEACRRFPDDDRGIVRR